MIISHLQMVQGSGAARNHGILPDFLPVCAGRLGAKALIGTLVILMLAAVGCYDKPGFSAKPMASDPVPEFADGVFTGTWITDGKYAQIVRSEDGFELRHSDDATPDPLDDLKFRIKLAGDVLLFEFQMKPEAEAPTVYLPCRADMTDGAIDLYCFYTDNLKTLRPEVEVQYQVVGDNDKVIDATPERLHDICAQLALDSKIFVHEMSLKRPRPDLVARAIKRAQSGKAAAEEELGKIYADGEIVARDEETAELWLRRAAGQGFPKAQFELALLLRHMPKQQVPDSQEVIFWLQSAADKGYAQAYGELGNSYKYGKDVTASAELALHWFEEGAKHGDAVSHSQLGYAYSSGELLPHDEQAALTHFSAAVALDPTDGFAWTEIARIRLDAADPALRNNQVALDAATRAAAIDPYGDQLRVLAQAQFANGQYQAAVENMRESIGSTGGSDDDKRKLALYEAAAQQEGQLQ